jgi:hypothetical protein
MLPAVAGFKFKAGENFNHPDKLHRDKHPYIEYFEDSAKASLRAKFEPNVPQ